VEPIKGPPRLLLTKREQEILDLVSLGLTNAEIARQLSLSRRTVESHVEHIRSKLDAPTRMRAVVEAGRARLLRVVDAETQQRSYNLPVQVTSFIGRATELAEVKTLLGNSRFVTIVGAGGVGKTRLAAQVGAELLDAYRDGVWLADLAKISAADSVASEIAFALGIKPQAFSEVFDHVLAHLKRRNLLLIIDNCEHVAPQTSDLIDAILQRCPSVTVLATARENLRHAGEHLYRLASLDVPERNDLSAEDALTFSGIALFVARARTANAHFTFADDDVGTLVEICRQLGGIALALELAAARTRTLSLRQLREHLHEQFRLLVSRDRAALPRHQTMRAALDWSYNLLSDDEQLLLTRLSIFQGGWTVEAISPVVGRFSDQLQALDAISSLIDKSLITVDFRGGSERYRLLEPVRQYAVGLLKDQGEFDAAALRHAEYFLEFTRRANEQWLVVEELERLASIEQEMDNIRAALEWALLTCKNPVLGSRIAANLWTFWQARHQHEGRRWLETAQSSVSPEAEPELTILLALSRCRLFLFTDVGKMLEACEQALDPARAFGNPVLLQRAVMYYAAALTVAHRPLEAQGLVVEALDLAKRTGDHYRAAYTLGVQCKVERRLGRYECARTSLAQMIEEHSQVHAPFDPSESLMILLRAGMEQLEGRLSNAIDLCREAHRIARAVHDPSQDIHAQYGLAAYLLLSGSADEALVHALSILKISRDELFPYGVGPAFQILAGVATQRGEHEQAARLLGYAQARFSEQGIPPDAHVEVDPEWFLEPLHDHFGEPRLSELMAEGAAWSEEFALGEAPHR
jgi:predicted ATPase/DNA-binding CsgD family transcriptional regulator